MSEISTSEKLLRGAAAVGVGMTGAGMEGQLPKVDEEARQNNQPPIEARDMRQFQDEYEISFEAPVSPSQEAHEAGELVSEVERSVVVDYFGGETDDATAERLLADVSPAVDSLQDIDYSKFQGEDKDQIIMAMEVAAKTGDNSLLARLVLDQAVNIAGSHGDFVAEKHDKTLSEIRGDNSTNTTEKVGLQNAIAGYQLSTDALGNINASLNIDQTKLTEMLANSPDVIVGAFQVGEVNLRYEHTRIKEPTVFDTEVNGKGYFVILPENYTGFPAGQIDEDGNVYFELEGEKLTYHEFKGEDFYNEEEFSMQLNEIKNAYSQEIQSKIANGEILPSDPDYTEIVPVDERITYVEPYNYQENIDQFVDFANNNPDKMIVQAAGNNTDLRELNLSELPDNAVLVSGYGGWSRVRTKKFGTDELRNVGAIDADIYVDFNDFYDDTEIQVMTSSESTAIVGGYVARMKELGVPQNEIKSKLQNEMSVFSEISDGSLHADYGENVSGYIFSREKADAYLLQLENHK